MKRGQKSNFLAIAINFLAIAIINLLEQGDKVGVEEVFLEQQLPAFPFVVLFANFHAVLIEFVDYIDAVQRCFILSNSPSPKEASAPRKVVEDM